MKKLLISALAELSLICTIMVSPTQAQTGVYTLNGGNASETTQTYSATLTDQSAVYVLNSGHLTMVNCTITKTGDASNVNNSSQYGINAGILANSAGTVAISGGSVTTNALGANGLFATGSGSSITMSNGTINASGGNAHGVDVTYGGVMTLTNVDVTTTGASSSALATDFGGGTVTVTGGTIMASSTAPNSHSAGIYSTGTITIYDATVTSLGDCGGVIDGANTISLTSSDLTGLIEGIKLWKTGPFSGTATVIVNGGSLTATAGDAFYVTGETGNAATASISVTGGAEISAGTGNIINVIRSSTASFTANIVTLNGNMLADATSALTVTLQNNTSLIGKAQHASLTIDSTSAWTVTENSILTTLTDPSGILGLTVTNIIGNVHNVHYDSSLAGNRYLGGLTYSLVNGGVLTPGSVDAIDDQQAALPTAWALYQNYPNPFNSTTLIQYDLYKPANVTLVIFDILGRRFEMLDNEPQEPGNHSFVWDSKNKSSGIYFYRIRAGDFTETKMMLLLK